MGLNLIQGLKKDGGWWGRRRRWLNHGIVVWFGVVGFFFLANLWFFSRLQRDISADLIDLGVILNSKSLASPRHQFQGRQIYYEKVERPRQLMYTRLLALAAHALADAEGKPEPRDLWKDTQVSTVSWKPCAYKRSWEPNEGTNGFIVVSANGGISQQRVAICNAVSIARLLNSTLVLPKFMYSNVWQDTSQFSSIYQEEHFINYLKADIKIVKELPIELQSLDLEAIGSLLTETEIVKEAKLSFYVKKVLPILLKNRVVHFFGFGNRLAFDPIPFDLQRLRCRCNFHALRFISKIQETGALLVQRMRHHRSPWSLLEHNLLDPSSQSNHSAKITLPTKASRYLAIHLRFEIDMAAYSLCYFGGGIEEKEELEAYREVHFPALSALWKTAKLPSPEVLRFEGQCPLTPEEAVLMLAALGFKRKTKVYIAGADIYGGKSRMATLKSLYPNLETKESLLSPSEIEPFRNFSSQEGSELNPFILSMAIRASAEAGNLVLGRQIHAATIKTGHQINVPVSNSIADMYSRCLSLPDARQYFSEMPRKDLITWNTMIAALDRTGSADTGRVLLHMLSQSIKPNSVTFTTIISSCANLSALSLGQQVHGAVLNRGFGENQHIANALIDMYAKCGTIADSRKVFNEMLDKGLVSCTSMIIGYGIHGHGKEAIKLFGEMMSCGIQPDSISFMGVISACSHAGLVKDGIEFFNLMESAYGVRRGEEVYGCVVDLLGRNGRLTEAMELIEAMPFEPDEFVWGALLGACKMHGNIELGSIAAQKILKLKPKGAKTYTILSNIFAAGSEWNWFAETMRLLRGAGGKKDAGMSWVDVREEVCSFVAGDRSSSYASLAYDVLATLACHMDGESLSKSQLATLELN